MNIDTNIPTNKAWGQQRMIIYCAINIINNKKYIGKTSSSFKRRMSEHKLQSKSKNFVFYRAIRKYGFSSFKWLIIETCSNAAKLNVAEIEWISILNTMDNTVGYNINPGGDGAPNGKAHHFYGKKRPEFAKSISGKNHPLYGIRGKLSPRYGQHHTDEAKRKIGISQLGVRTGEKNPSYDHTIYSFYHKKHGKIVCTKYKLKKQFNIDDKSMCLLCRGQRQTAKGWSVQKRGKASVSDQSL